MPHNQPRAQLPPDALDSFPALAAIPFVAHAFTTRLATPHAGRHGDLRHLLARLPIPARAWRTARQVHGRNAAAVSPASPDVTPDADALCTDHPGLALAVQVADCCPVFVADTRRRAIGVAHSGRKGTELDVLGALFDTMASAYGTSPADCVVQLGPCIRPPHYEVDFAARIRESARARGTAVHDPGTCTAARLDRYYSYRAERGQTGRMAAAICIRP